MGEECTGGVVTPPGTTNSWTTIWVSARKHQLMDADLDRKMREKSSDNNSRISAR
jgi:hypothetical protein